MKKSDRLHELADLLIAKSKERRKLHAAIFKHKATLQTHEQEYRDLQAERVALQNEFRELAPKTLKEALIAFPEYGDAKHWSPDPTLAGLLPPKPREPKQ